MITCILRCQIIMSIQMKTTIRSTPLPILIFIWLTGFVNINSTAAADRRVAQYNQNAWNHIEIELSDNTIYLTVNGTAATAASTLKAAFTHLVLYIPSGPGGRWYVDNLKVEYDNESELREAAEQLTLESIGVWDANGVSADLTLPQTIGENHYAIEWTSENQDAITNEGTVIRRGFTQETVLNAKIMVNENTYINKQFALKVLREETDNDMLILSEYAEYALTFDKLSDEPENAVTKNISLPQAGPDGISVIWESSQPDIIAPDGTVIRPSYTDADADVTLTAILSLNGSETTVVYELTVLKEINPYDMIKAARERAELAMTQDGIDVQAALGETGFDISKRLALPTEDENGTKIIWTSDNTALISNNGTVTRPDETTSVIMTAEYNYNGTIEAVYYKFNVLLSDASMASKDIELISSEGWDALEDSFNVPKTGSLYQTAFTWTSSSTLISVTELTDSYRMTVRRPEATAEIDTSVTLTVTGTVGEAAVSKEFTAVVVKLPTSEEIIGQAYEALVFDVIKANNTAEDNITGDLALISTMDQGITIEWSSSDANIINGNGEVFNPAPGSSDALVTLTATISRGIYAAPMEKVFVLTVKPFATEEELYDKLENALTFDCLSEESISFVTTDLTLPTTWYYGSTIEWVSDSAAISIDSSAGSGIVTRPIYGTGNAIVYLTANIHYSDDIISKTFAVTVPEENYLEAEEVIFSEDCESWRIGTTEFTSSVGTWNMPVTDDGVSRGTITAQIDPFDSNNTAIRIDIDENNGSGDMRMDLGREYSGKIIAGMRVCVTGNNMRPTISLRSRSEGQLSLHMYPDGTMKNLAYFHSNDAQSEFTFTDLYPLGEWFDLRFEVDTNLQKTHIFINDTCITEDGKVFVTWNGVTEPYDSSQGIPYIYYQNPNRNAPIQMLAFSAWRDNSEGTPTSVYVDDLYIRKRVTYTEEQLALGERYEREFLSNNNISQLTSDLVLPNIRHNTITISAESSNLAVLSNSGKITRSETDRTIQWIVSFDDGNNIYKKIFPITVASTSAAEALTDEEAVKADLEAVIAYLKDNYMLTAVADDMVFPQSGAYGSIITYETSNNAIITADGKITRGAVNQNAAITIKASKGEAAASDSITVTVLKRSESSQSGSTIVSGAGSGGGGGGFGLQMTPVADTVPENPDDTVQQAETDARYTDVPRDYWAANAIESLSEKGIVSGNGDGTFAPERFVTREEFVKMIVEASGISLGGTTDKFTDVPLEAWFNTYVAAASENGIVNGIEDTLFGAGTQITRQDLVVMLYRAAGLDAIPSTESFSDDGLISDYAKEAVYTLHRLGIVSGRTVEEFAPLMPATRAEAAALIYRMAESGLLNLEV